jgi:hypothetical protein
METIEHIFTEDELAEAIGNWMVDNEISSFDDAEYVISVSFIDGNLVATVMPINEGE